MFEYFAGTLFRKTRHRIKALLKLGELECGFRDKFFKVVKKKKKKGRKERWTLSLKFENGLFRIKNKLTVCSLPSNGINFFNSERGGKFNPSPSLPVKRGKLTRASLILHFIFIVFVLRSQRRGGRRHRTKPSIPHSSSNATSPLFRGMEITRIKCLTSSTMARSRNAARPFHHRLLLQIFSNPSTVIRVYDRLVSE